MAQSVFEQEKEKLEEILQKYSQGMEYNRLLLGRLPEMYSGQPDMLSNLLAQTQQRLHSLQRSYGKPYFARLDFWPEQESQPQCCYIGKIGIVDENQQTLTVDWRAPIAALYYDSNLGSVSYKAPMGIIGGQLQLKRQLEIEGGILTAFNDVDTVANDELLKPYLSANADNRLKNIVASIQSEQNQIIREDIEQNLIVQGVAGSGKTTVALHRIAYLVYDHRDSIRGDQYMVIGPNQFFISYISAVLPDLDVESVPQHTFESLAAQFIQEPYILGEGGTQLSVLAAGGIDSGIERLKVSLAYKEALDGFLAHFEANLVPSQPLVVRGFQVLSASRIKSLYQEMDFSFADNLQAQVDKFILVVSAYLQNRQGALRARLGAFIHQKEQAIGAQATDQAAKQAEMLQLKRDYKAILKELDSDFRSALKKHLVLVDTPVLKLYQAFMQEAEIYLPAPLPQIKEMQRTTLAGLKKKTIGCVDLPALVYLKLQIKGCQDYREFRHVVIDEAQDLGEFHFWVLRQLLSHSTFTIVGDLAQAIYAFRSIDSWERVTQQIFQGQAVIRQMRKSYRTTVEIMLAANQVTAQMHLKPALPVIRHGDPVGYRQCLPEQQVSLIYQLILEQKNKGCKTLAVISKTIAQSQALYHALQALGLVIEDVNDSSQQYLGGVCTITAYLAKGLEFDGVILGDASAAVYSAESSLDLHLLYVAMTRPLHQLAIVHVGALAKPLVGQDF